MKRSLLVARRARAHRLLIGAAAVTALFTVTVLAALGGYAASVTSEGVRTTLAQATFDTAGTQITSVVSGSGLPDAQRKVAAAVAKVYGRVPVTTSLSARGDSYAVPGQEHSDHPQLTTFAIYSGIESHARLTTGRWPSAATTGTIQAALPVPAAKAMGLSPGQTITLHSRVSGPTVRVTITGLFEIGNRDDYFWGGDRLVTQGTERLGYTTFGPLVVPPSTFTARFVSSVTARWLLLPSVQAIPAGQLEDVAARARTLPAALGTGITVKSSLPDLLSGVDRALLVSRSTLLIPALQLLVLSVYTLMLVARLLAEHRRVEITLMRARGAAGRQIAALAIGEAALLAAPSAVAAPFLAPLLVRSAAATPVLKTGGLRLHLAPSGLMWGIAIVAALACAVAITLPPLRGIRQTYNATLAARGRGERRGAIQRAGADLALVFLAGLAIWQLAHYGGPVTSTSNSGLGVDPLIVAGPALALLAGGTLMLRLVPLASRAGERATSRSRGFASAIGTRQVSRRPLRTAGPALLLIMTVAVGVLSVATGATWRQSQLDQADFQAGADLRISAPSNQGAPSVLGQGDVYRRLPDVTAASPVLRDTARSGSTDVTLLAADAAALAGPLRPHSALPATAPVARLATGTPAGAGVPVPGRPDRLSIGLRVGQSPGAAPAGWSVVISDAFHVTYEVNLGSVPSDGREHAKVVDLAGLAGQDGRIAYPVSVRGFRFALSLSPEVPGDLTVTGIRPGTANGLGPPVPLPAGTHWSGQTGQAGVGAGAMSFRSVGLVTLSLLLADDVLLQNTQLTGSFVLVPGDASRGGSQEPAPIPAIVTRDLATRAHVGVGGRIAINENANDQPITVAGIVPALPSTTANTPGVLVDWTALQDQELISGIIPPPPAEWWLAARSGRTAPAMRVLDAHASWSRGVVDRLEVRHRLRDAPLGGGALQGALVIGFAAALVFALIGFAVNTAVSARERLTEFAILRALGVDARQVFGLIAIEQTFLVGLGIVGGVVLGVVVTHLVVPHIVLTAAATTPYPPVRVLIQWPVVLAMLAAIVVLLAVALFLLVRSLRRRGLGQAIRLGEDR